MRISDLYDGLLIRSGYMKALEDQQTLEAESRIENLMEFKSVIAEKQADAEKLGEIQQDIAVIKSEITMLKRGA